MVYRSPDGLSKRQKVVAPVDRMASKLTNIGALLIEWTSAFQVESVKM